MAAPEGGSEMAAGWRYYAMTGFTRKSNRRSIARYTGGWESELRRSEESHWESGRFEVRKGFGTQLAVRDEMAWDDPQIGRAHV